MLTFLVSVKYEKRNSNNSCVPVETRFSKTSKTTKNYHMAFLLLNCLLITESLIE